MRPLPSAKRLRALFFYNAEWGWLIWRYRPEAPKAWNTKYAGKRAGGPEERDPCRYRQISINGKRFAEHRLVWKWVTGNEPADEIDHRDHVKGNNRFANLRPATHVQNSQNKATKGRTLPRGVYVAPTGRIYAAITTGKRTAYLGSFATVDEAALAYVMAADVAFGEYAGVANVFA